MLDGGALKVLCKNLWMKALRCKVAEQAVMLCISRLCAYLSSVEFGELGFVRCRQQPETNAPVSRNHYIALPKGASDICTPTPLHAPTDICTRPPPCHQEAYLTSCALQNSCTQNLSAFASSLCVSRLPAY